MGRPAPWTIAMVDATGDDWTPIEDVLAAGARAVPPGRAIQMRERNRRNVSDGTGPRRATTDDERIRIGARAVARGSLEMQVKRGRLERNGDLVRRRP